MAEHEYYQQHIGFWGPPTGNPDWCEENYVVTYYIAEFWNTISSLPIAFAGLYGLSQSIQQSFGWPYSLSWFALAVVGFGSVAFHGTLLFEGQAMDELSMIWCVAIFLVVSLRRPTITYAICGLYLPAFTYSYFAASEYFVFFILSYIFLVGVLAVRSVILALDSKSKTMKALVFTAGGVYVGGFLCLWLPEHFLCVLGGPPRAPLPDCQYATARLVSPHLGDWPLLLPFVCSARAVSPGGRLPQYPV